MKNHKTPFLLVVTFVFSLTHTPYSYGDLVTDWDLGEQAPDFSAFKIDSKSGLPVTTNWHTESGADAYVVSTCAMWCGPCRDFAEDSETLVQAMAAEGIHVEVYDFIYQNNNLLEPTAADAQAWIDVFWTSDSENVWYGGDLSESASNSVTIDIFEASINAGGSGSAIPVIVILDRNFVVRDLQEGYFPSQIEDAVRLVAVPEPGAGFVLMGGLVWCAVSCRRPNCKTTRSNPAAKN